MQAVAWLRNWHPAVSGLLLPLLLAACAGSVPSADGTVVLANVMPEAGPITKNVSSLRQTRFTNLVPQHTDFSCGAAAVATILKYAYGLEDADEQQVLQEMLKYADEKIVVEKGFSLLDIKTFVEALGMQAVGFEIDPENLDRIKVPTIVLLDIKGYKHFVVFKTARDGRVYLADPALGNRVMTRDDFVAAWNGVALAIVADFYNTQTVLVQAKGPASARNLLTRRAPVLDAPTIGFGLERLDLMRF